MLKARWGRLLHECAAFAQHRVCVVAALRVVLVHVQLARFCVLDLQRAAGRVDVAAVQGVLGTLRRLQAVELQHRLHPVLLEYHYSNALMVYLGYGKKLN